MSALPGQLCAPFATLDLKLDWPYVMTWQSHVFNKSQARDFHRFVPKEIKSR